MTELEEKVYQIRLRINKLKHDLKEQLEKRTEKEKAVFIFDKKDPHFLRKNDD
tara:strand:- start:446 stop:604 length:159 start_codon:yes stop_codon:yes gene_type:complete